MKQITYSLESRDDCLKLCREIGNDADFLKASCVYAQVYVHPKGVVWLNDFLFALRDSIPNIVIAGETSYEHIVNGKRNIEMATASFMLFDDSTAELFEYDMDTYDEKNVAHELSAKINDMDDAVAVQFFSNILDVDFLEFFDSFNIRNRDVVFFGAGAGVGVGELIMNESRVVSESASDIFVMGNSIMSAGIVAVVFRGDDLHVKSSASLGWTPTGKTMTITKVIGSQELVEIDDTPAVEIYERYTSAKPGAFFISNVLDFPLILHKGDVAVARNPSFLMENGHLFFFFGLHEGDDVQFSFGNTHRIMEQALECAREAADFYPEAMILNVSGTRSGYLGDYEDDEINYYRKVCPTVCGTGVSMGEITRINGIGEILNNALVFTAFREGVPEKGAKKPRFRHISEMEGSIPLIERLYTFMEASTTEFVRIQEMQKQQELLNEVRVQTAANEAKSDFLSSMSHEIRTPINAVLGMDEMILREAKEPNILEYAENIKIAGNTLLNLINDILDFSKIEAGKMNLVPEEYSMSSLLYDIFMMISNSASQKGLDVIFDVDGDIPDRLLGDEMRIKQALLNVANNAVKYTHEGSVTIIVDFEKAQGHNVDITFHVVDTGIGIKQEDMENLFKPFERLDEKNNHAILGTGLGMSITTRILSMMGSELKVDSEYGVGSDFYFTITQSVVDEAPIGNFQMKVEKKADSRPEYQASFEASTAKVLAVDDTPLNLTVIKGLLKESKLQIDTAQSGIEAVQLCEDNEYDVILMDHRMPDMDGTQTMMAIRYDKEGKNSRTPIAVLTANAVSGMREQLLDEGFDAYLSKPVDPVELEKLLMELITSEKIEGSGIGEIVSESGSADAAEASGRPDMGDVEFPEGIYGIVALDMESGRKASGSADVYRNVLREYADSCTMNYNRLADDMEQGDLKDLTTKVHALKSSSRLAGALDISERAARLEQCGDAGDWDTILNELPELLADYRELCDAIKKAFDDAAGTRPVVEKKDLDDAYEALYEFVEAFDFDSADNVMRLLSQYDMPKGEEQFYEDIRGLMAAVEREQILLLIEDRR